VHTTQTTTWHILTWQCLHALIAPTTACAAFGAYSTYSAPAGDPFSFTLNFTTSSQGPGSGFQFPRDSPTPGSGSPRVSTSSGPSVHPTPPLWNGGILPETLDSPTPAGYSSSGFGFREDAHESPPEVPMEEPDGPFSMHVNKKSHVKNPHNCQHAHNYLNNQAQMFKSTLASRTLFQPQPCLPV
jgi:hypothetical protein